MKTYTLTSRGQVSLILHSQPIFGQQPGKVVKRKYIDAIVCPHYRPMGIDDNPALQAFEIGDCA